MPPPPPPLRQGQFWWINDEAIAFPANREGEPHQSRGCIIVQGDAMLDLGHPVVLVVPTSSQTDRKEAYDLVLPSPPVPGAECVVLIAHVQPVLRTDLVNMVSRLPDQWAHAVLAAILQFLGVTVEDGEGEEPDLEF